MVRSPPWASSSAAVHVVEVESCGPRPFSVVSPSVQPPVFLVLFLCGSDVMTKWR